MTTGVASYILCVEEGVMGILSFGFVTADQTQSSYRRDCVLRVRKTIRVFKSTKCIGA